MAPPEKPFLVKCRESVLMTRSDADAFSAELLRAFPRMRFVREDYWHKFWAFDAWREACARASDDGVAEPEIADFIRDPGREPPDYFESLGTEREQYFYAWVEPPHWRPRWEVRTDYVRLSNKPRLHFLFRRAAFDRHSAKWAERAHNDHRVRINSLPNAPRPEDDDEVLTLRGDRMLGGWMKGDESAKAFVAKVWRIASKITTNLLIAYDETTREPYPHGPERRSHVWAGPDAVAWALRRKHNYLEWAGHWYKPPEPGSQRSKHHATRPNP
jgi:hypothetical protein